MELQLRVLVVDDEERFRENIVRILCETGMDAEGAEDGDHALTLLEDVSFDVVLLDMKMPGLSGEETLRRMRGLDCQAEVVVLTGHASMSTALDMMQLGAFDYLLKPASVTDLVRKIRMAGEKKRLRDGKMDMLDILGGAS